MVGRLVLAQVIEVRILVPEQRKRDRILCGLFFFCMEKQGFERGRGLGKRSFPTVYEGRQGVPPRRDERWRGRKPLPRSEAVGVATFESLTLLNKKNIKIRKSQEIRRFLVVLVRYPDCKNYEVEKILVFEDIEFIDIKHARSIDPHFCDSDDHPSPIARFL